MKKLLAFLLSTALVTSSFAAVLPAGAKSVDGVITPDLYDGSMPEELENVFGFEGAVLGETYANCWHNSASPEDISHVSIDSTEAASGKSSLKINLDNTRSWEVRNFVKEVAAFDPSSITLKENTAYTVKAKFKTDGDFDGQVYVFLLNDISNTDNMYCVGNNNWATENVLINNTSTAEGYNPWYSGTLEKTSKTDSLDLSDWTEVIATNRLNSQSYSASTMSSWLSNEKPGIAILVQASKGTIWIDDIDLVPVDEYNGILTSENQETADNLEGGTYKFTSDGGFETELVWWKSQAGFGDQDGANKLTKTTAVSHSGSGAAKVEMVNASTTDACMGFYLNLNSEDGKKLLENENGYYVEAWVKLEDFNGKIYSKICNGHREWGGFLWTDYYTSEHYMLGGKDGKTVSAEDIGNGWVKIRSSFISAEKLKDWINTGRDNTSFTSILLDLHFMGSGTLYVDDVTIKPIEGNTVTYTASHQDDCTAFQSINLTTKSDCDIYYTLDGTDPRYSKTAMLYDNAYTVVLGSGYNRILAAALDKETVLFGDVVPTNMFGTTGAFNVTINASEETKAAYSEVVMHHADHMDKVDISFKLNASGINGKVTAKMFLVGYGLHKLTVGGNTYTGGWVNSDCKIAEIAEDGTADASVTLDNMDKGYSRLITVLESESTQGTAAITDVEVDVTPYAKAVVAAAEVDTPVNNFYTADDYYDSALKSIEKEYVLTNNTAYYQDGTFNYKVTDPYGKVICEKSEKVTIDANDSYDDSFTIDGVDKYGVYTVEYSWTDALGRVRNAGSSVFGFVKDNTEVDGKLGISSHMINNGENYDYASLIESYAKMGVKYVRLDAYWNDIETEKGVYNFPAGLTNSVNAVKEAGLTPVIIINQYNYNLYTDDTAAVPAFASFAEAVVDKYGEGYYEVINEPNMALEMGSDYMREPLYAKILRAVYEKIHSKGATVIAGNVSHMGHNFLENMITADSDILECMDIWSVHPYAFNLGTDSSYESTEVYHTYFAELKKTYLDPNGIEFWAGEFGYAVCNTEYGVTDDEAAYYTVRQLAGLDKDGVNGAHIIYTDNGSSYNYYQETNFGIYGSENKKTAVALNAYANILSGYSLKTATEADGIYAYEYTKDGEKSKYMLWSTDGEKAYTLNVPYGKVKVLDIYGNDVTAEVTEADSGYSVALTLTEKPVYVQYNSEPANNPREYENVVNGDFEGEVFKLEGNDLNATASLDTNTVWDGMQSARIDIPENSAEQKFVRFRTSTVDLSEYDANVRYRVRFMLKASEEQLGTAKVKLISKFNGSEVTTYAGDWRWYGETATRLVETESYYLEDQTLSDSWKAYETAPFTIFGDQIEFVFNLSSHGATLWIDNIELVPVEDNSGNHGKVYTSYNSETGKLYVTAKADNGYELDTIRITYSGVNYTQSTDAVKTVYSRDNVTTTVYELDFAQFKENLLTHEDEHCKYINATFKKAEVTLLGDATDNGTTDIIDLVRVKKYQAKTTFDIDLVNADYDSDGVVDATDLAALKKDLMK